MSKLSPFAKFAWGLLAYNLLVIAWGAFVRASFSGDGCGSHWPLCDGEVIPAFGQLKQVFEFSHRVSSGLVLPLVVVLMVWAFRKFPKGHQARKFSTLSVGFTVTEALIGAVLVLFGWTNKNDSVARAISMSLHLTNTFLLIGCLVLTALAAQGLPRTRPKGQGPIAWALFFACGAVMVLGVSGAISALGHQLKPTNDVLQTAISPTAHWMVKLQPFHPLIATSVGLYLMLIGGLLVHLRPDPRVRIAVRWLITAYAVQMLLGLLNIVMMAPIWMQIVHLLAADALWIALVWVAALSMSEGARRRETDPAPDPDAAAPKLRGKELINAYISLTKPRIISLLLFTTIAAAFIAAGGWPGGWLLLAISIGGYCAAGAANAINMVIDSDMVAQMKRTGGRPTVTHAIQPQNALMFGLALAAVSFAILSIAANLLSAVLALAGLLFYVVVYTLVLKRRTWQNIVIGGAAGAFPPLVGYTAVTDQLTPMAWFLFAIIFVWTPVHFWALALLIKDDYANAGVPMLPVVHGERATVIQIGIYSILTVLLCVLPLVQRQLGIVYLVGALLLNAMLLVRTLQLYQKPDHPHARGLFKYSMIYLALLFIVIAIDRAVIS